MALNAARQRADGATLTCVYLVILLIVPARLVFSKIPMTLGPVTVFAAGLGVLWVCSQLVNTLAIAKGRNVVRTAFALLLATQLMTYAVATRRYLPPDELNLTDSGMIRMLATVAVGVFVCDAIRNRARLDRVLRVLTAAIAIVAGFGLIQFAVGIDLTQYLNLPGLRAASEYSNPVRANFRRPSGTTNHPIEFGLVCAIAVPLAAHQVLRALDRGLPTARWWLCLGLVGGGAMVSLSRTAILALAIAFIVLLIALPGRRRIFALVIGMGFIGAAGVLIPGLIGTVFRLFSNIEEDPSVTSRTDDYTEAWRQVDLHPWLGRGFGTYIPSKYQILDNQYLMTLIENGWVGLCAFVAIFLAGIYAAVRVCVLTREAEVRNLCACLIGCLLIGLVGAATFDLLSFGVATGLMFLLIGVCGALLRVIRHGESENDLPPAHSLAAQVIARLRTVQRIGTSSRPREDA